VSIDNKATWSGTTVNKYVHTLQAETSRVYAAKPGIQISVTHATLGQQKRKT